MDVCKCICHSALQVKEAKYNNKYLKISLKKDVCPTVLYGLCNCAQATYLSFSFYHWKNGLLGETFRWYCKTSCTQTGEDLDWIFSTFIYSLTLGKLLSQSELQFSHGWREQIIYKVCLGLELSSLQQRLHNCYFSFSFCDVGNNCVTWRKKQLLRTEASSVVQF